MPWRKSSHSSGDGECPEVAAWRKASASKESNCAEVGQDGAVVGVRDSALERRAAGSSPVLMFDAGAWAAFVARVRSA